jgi:hypothetical protein
MVPCPLAIDPGVNGLDVEPEMVFSRLVSWLVEVLSRCMESCLRAVIRPWTVIQHRPRPLTPSLGFKHRLEIDPSPLPSSSLNEGAS